MTDKTDTRVEIADSLRCCAQGIDLGADGMGWSPDTELLRKAADEIERLSADVAAERERCAKVCDRLDVMSRDPMVCRGSAQECAAAIRALD